MQYPITVPGVALQAGKFSNGDPLSGIPPSLDRAEDMNRVYDELIALVVGAGLTPSEADSTQILQAVKALAGITNDYIARFTTTANINLTGLGTQAGGDWASALAAGDLILVKDQTTPSQNGWYVAAVGTWARTSFADSSIEIRPACLTQISEGATLADTVWMLTTDAPIVLATTALNYARKDTSTIPDASTTVKGKVQLATSAEAQAGIDALKAITSATLAAAVLAMGQTWQNVTASRAASTTYTNSTGKPIMVSIWAQTSGTTDTYSNSFITVDGAVRAMSTSTSRGSVTYSFVTTIVPNGSTYSSSSGGTQWHELR